MTLPMYIIVCMYTTRTCQADALQILEKLTYDLKGIFLKDIYIIDHLRMFNEILLVKSPFKIVEI